MIDPVKFEQLASALRDANVTEKRCKDAADHADAAHEAARTASNRAHLALNAYVRSCAEMPAKAEGGNAA